MANTSAIKSSSTSATTSKSPAFHSRSRSFFSAIKVFSLSLKAAAFSKSWASIADSFSFLTSAILLSNSLKSGGAVILLIRRRAPASSIKSIALSGSWRSLMYRYAKVAAETKAESVIVTLW